MLTASQSARRGFPAMQTKRQRTGALQDASRSPGRSEFPPSFGLRWQARRDTAFARTDIFAPSLFPVRSKAPSPLPLCRRTPKSSIPRLFQAASKEKKRGRFPVRASNSNRNYGAAGATSVFSPAISLSRSSIAARRERRTRPFSSTPRHLTAISSPTLQICSVFATRKLASSLM